MLKDLIIFHKAYDFLKYAHIITMKFPKSEKFVLAQKINNGCLEFICFLIQANNAVDKSMDLNQAEISLEKLRIWFRLSFDLRYIGIKQYENSSKMLDEIGRLLGGWRKKFSRLSEKGTGG